MLEVSKLHHKVENHLQSACLGPPPRRVAHTHYTIHTTERAICPLNSTWAWTWTWALTSKKETITHSRRSIRVCPSHNYIYIMKKPNQHQKRGQGLKTQHHHHPPFQTTDLSAPCPGPAPAAPPSNPSFKVNLPTGVSWLRTSPCAGAVMVEPMHGCRLR